MISSPLSAVALARLALLGARSRTSTTETLVYLAIAAGLITVVGLAVYGVNRLTHYRRYKSPTALFQGLCQTHGLDRGSRQLLKQVTRHHQLGQPARVFTEPTLLDPARLKQAFGSRLKEVTALRKRLFTSVEKDVKPKGRGRK